ncbi:hypothetical protein BaRGS_00025081 [Batillaria attramentaria]|uniref:Apple domain-containing protein n=1 Tax=Batillaria attramentaria TaxID=370345 RepID=A0ABD0K9A4_9CAEN
MATALVIVLSLAAIICEGGQLRHFLWENIGLGDVIFTSNLKFSSTAKSVTHCALNCSNVEDCVTFTFTRQTVMYGECRGHFSYMTSLGPTSPSPGSKTFRNTDWRNKYCVNNPECFALNSECNAGVCLCIPGYYYSESNNYCVPDCEAADLQGNYMMIPDASLKDNNIATLSDTTVDDCKTACNQNPQCLTFDYRSSNANCLLQNETALTDPASLERGSGVYDMYQKHCA